MLRGILQTGNYQELCKSYDGSLVLGNGGYPKEFWERSFQVRCTMTFCHRFLQKVGKVTSLEKESSIYRFSIFIPCICRR